MVGLYLGGELRSPIQHVGVTEGVIHSHVRWGSLTTDLLLTPIYTREMKLDTKAQVCHTDVLYATVQSLSSCLQKAGILV